MANKDTSKTWFQTGDFPTQAQFWQVFDWLRWKDENLTIAEVVGLAEILNSFGSGAEAFTVGVGWDNRYNIPIGYVLEKIVVVPVVDCAPYCSFVGGTTGDIIPLDVSYIIGVAGVVWSVNLFNASAAKVIEVSNVPNTSKVYFIKRKIY